MIAIIDYGVGNLFSVEKAIIASGGKAVVTSDAKEIKSADKLVLPGVGAFGDCMKNLVNTGLVDIIKEEISNRKPMLGICVGLQLLFEESEESPGVAGLSVLKGRVKKIDSKGLKLPHIGWNSLNIADVKSDIDIFKDLGENSYVYFVHSFYAEASESIISATTEYGEEITAAVAKENIVATQFHPEKSGDVGLKILKNFVEF
ncbi:MAG: imidazole glycerol phosphate synthase subunit HisH [Selenomonadaceae bacterium]|nr:imidazole glycerol phosphate synthase subunit HisH [Selenomonadaceae bacterium]